MSALPQGADLFASDAPPPQSCEPAYQVSGRLLHPAEVRYAPFLEAADFKPEHGVRTGVTLGLDTACCGRFSVEPTS